MDYIEELEEMASAYDVDIIENYRFESNRIKGLYCDNVIALSHRIKSKTEKACILAEELGHYHTTTGDIIDLADTQNRKQEYRARLWAYDKRIGLERIISAYKNRCIDLHDMADYLNVTEEFLEEALESYRHKYGTGVKYDNYVIGFEPQLYIIELFE